MSKTYVFDASAILVLLEAGRDAPRMEYLMQEALQTRSSVLISVLNLAEVFYILWKRRGEEKARSAIARVSRSPLQCVPIDLTLALKAGEIKVLHNLSLVDSMAAALSVLQQATLVTSDHDFDKLGRHFPILWLTST